MGDIDQTALGCTNLGLHLLVGTAAIDVVAICLHPLGLKEAEQSHAMFAQEKVPVLAPDTPITASVSLAGDFRQTAYRAAVESGCESQRAIARHLGVTARTIRNWVKTGVVT